MQCVHGSEGEHHSCRLWHVSTSPPSHEDAATVAIPGTVTVHGYLNFRYIIEFPSYYLIPSTCCAKSTHQGGPLKVLGYDRCDGDGPSGPRYPHVPKRSALHGRETHHPFYTV